MAEDLFVWIDSLWSKRQLEGTFPVFVAHRFLASDQLYAIAARELWRDVRDPNLIFRTWQGLLPKERGGPRLSYPAPKKAPAAEELTQRMTAVLGGRRHVIEEMQAVVAAAGRLLDLYYEFGIEPPEELIAKQLDAEQPAKRGRKKAQPEPPAGGGLLSQVT